MNSLGKPACLWLLLLLAVSRASATDASTDWNVAVLDQLLASATNGQTSVQIDDMLVPVKYLQAWRDKLAGGPQPQLAFSGTFAAWTGGNVYYSFDASVTASNQKAFLDAVAEWATFANLHFIQRTAQANYILVTNNASLSGGLSFVGMVGGPQLLQIGPTSWNRATLCHEVGHALGLVHEHQRSDRDSYVSINTNNILAGHLPDFVKLTDSQNKSAYDFLSVMHYSRNAFSVAANSNTIVPLPAYASYLNVMGQQFDPVLSAGDRAGMISVYGAGPGATSVVTNTQDGGPGSLRAALYYAYDHPGTTITFNIPVTDSGLSNGVFNILPSDGLPGLWGNTTLDATTEPTNSNPAGPEILLNGALCHTGSSFPSGLQFKGTNSIARGFVINNFPEYSVLMDGSNCVGNTISGCYLGIDPTGVFAVTNGVLPAQISGGAVSNTIGGTTAAARNVIGGSVYQGLVIRDAGTRFNVVAGNYIGLNAAGSAALPNAWSGIEIFGGAQSNLIGGFTAATRNVISGNTDQGVAISDAGSTGNIVAGNFIGLNPAGAAALPNGWSGIQIFGGATANIIGPANVISGNTDQGVVIGGTGTAGNRVLANFIGVDPTGATAIANGWSGANIFGGATGNFIGGNTPGAGNVISGNGNQGVLIQDAGTGGNFVQGNLIGLNAAGIAVISNAWSGVEIYNGPAANLIGGYGGARNFISGNGNYGVIVDYGSSLNVIQGNTVGLNVSNAAAIPNQWQGVAFYAGAVSNLLGGTTVGAANLISGNELGGVAVELSGATNNTVRGNSIYGNNSAIYLALWLYNGGNNMISAPTLTSAVVTTNLTINGSYNGLNGVVYQLDFYSDAPGGNVGGRVWLGSKPFTGTGGSAAFASSLGGVVTNGRAITATVTDPAGNTSQFSSAVAATMTSSVNDGIPNAWRALYFGGSGTTTNSQSASFADPDHDGMSNFQEFLAGTNPTNTASALSLTALNPMASTNVVSLNSSSGGVYRIMARSDLLTNNWAVLADQVVGTGTNILFWDPAAPAAPKRFYRAQVLW